MAGRELAQLHKHNKVCTITDITIIYDCYLFSTYNNITSHIYSDVCNVLSPVLSVILVIPPSDHSEIT